MPSKLEFYAFPRLKSAKKEVDANHMDYKSGATFSGQLAGRKRVGYGVFIWPNGDRYTGEYEDNERHGKGEQVWSDGANFTGDFIRDTRHGYGEHIWEDGESYKGLYFKDHRHGKGTYTWPNASRFDGTFYKNKKEGYGIFKFCGGNEFQGLYINDEREGPGVLTYPDSDQDVGLWRKERLIKLCSVVEGAFTMADHPEFDYNPKEHVVSLDIKNLHNSTLHHSISISSTNVGARNEVDESLRAAMEQLSKFNFQTTFDTFQSGTAESVDMNTLTYDREEYDHAFFGDGLSGENENESVRTLTALNNTPSLIEMQLHVMTHRDRESAVALSVNGLLRGDRGAHGKKGPIELTSEELIKAAAEGNYARVHMLLSKGAVNVNVADKNGHIGLIGAAVHMHRDIINCILDNGADVNKLNDEGLSALAACHVLFYPIESFKYNIAERYLPKPPGEGCEELPTENDNIGSGSRVAEDQRSQQGLQRPTTTMRSDAGAAQSSRMDPPSVAGQRAGDFYDIPSPDKDIGLSVGVEDGSIPEWDPDEESVEERISDGKHGSIFSRTVSSPKADTLASLKEFESDDSLVGLGIKVTEDMIERSATVMTNNPRVVSRGISKGAENLDEARRRAIAKAEHSNMEATIRLLLRRGADPNSSSVPMPVIFFAIKAADVNAVSILLEKGAATEARLSPDKEGLSPLHIASAIRGPEGVQITELLLKAGANPNSRSLDKDLDQDEENLLSPLDSSVKLKPGLDDSIFLLLLELEETEDLHGSRTPLHIACDRDDDYELARQVVHLLLENGANPNVLCKGESPLSLAIASGNDLAIDELLSCNANPSLPLGQSIGSALCVAANTQFEFRRTPQQRIALIDKLVRAGANILAPVAVGVKRQMGTAMDYTYWMFNQDRRIAHMPYHALTHAERDTYNARRKLLSHLGEILREAAVKRERERLEQEENEGLRSVSPGHGFLYTGAGAKPSERGLVRSRSKSPSRISESGVGPDGGKQVAFQATTKDSSGVVQLLVDQEEEIAVRKPLFRYCYECGRSVGVRLSACTRCKEVYYCSKACKIKAWNARHKEECLRIGGRSRSPSPKGSNALQNNTGSAANNPAAATNSGSGHQGGSGSNANGQMDNSKGSIAKSQQIAEGQVQPGGGDSEGKSVHLNRAKVQPADGQSALRGRYVVNAPRPECSENYSYN